MRYMQSSKNKNRRLGLLRQLPNRIRSYHFFRGLASLIFSTPWLVNSRLYLEVEDFVVRRKARRLQQCVPRILHIENTNHCNAKCIMCPNLTMSRSKSFMDDFTYTRAITEAVKFAVPTVSIVSIGEPFLDKKIIGRIAQAKQLGLEVTTATNGSLIGHKCADALIDAGLDELQVSLDTFSKEIFQTIRIGLNFEDVISNIEGFLALRRQRRAKRPKVILRYLSIPQNQQEIRKFIRRWQGKVDRVIISNSHDWCCGVSGVFRGKFHSRNLRRVACRLIWEGLMVHHDGSVAACCHDYEGSMAVGNILAQSLEEIWHGGPLKRLRKAHMDGDLKKYPACVACQINTIWFG